MIYEGKALFKMFSEYWEKHTAIYAEQKPGKLYVPVHYISQGGGKRMRPLFTLMACNLFNDDPSPALASGFCVELFHNFTLLHDDIMDDAPLRRGRQTVHEKWDVNTAILSGDLMMIESLRHLAEVKDPALRVRISDYFIAAAVGVCEGQQMDMDFEERDDVSLEEYIEMIRLKTAVLPAEGMAMGAASGGATEEQVEAVRRFGNAVGIAFQIQDDILDTYGDPNKFGKKVGGDIAQNKKTYLYLTARAKAEGETLKSLLHHYSDAFRGTEEEKIKEVTRIFDELDVKGAAEAEKKRLTQEGLGYLTSLGLPEERISPLRDFSLALIDREK